MAISACGFQLRGSQINAESLQGLKISLSSLKHSSYARFENTSFDKIIKRQLVAAGAEVISLKQEKNTAIEAVDINIELLGLSFSQQGVSRDESGRANEHEVTARLDFQLSNSNSVVTEQSKSAQADLNTEPEVRSITASANYFQSYRNPIGGQAQRRETRELLLQQLAQSLLYQVHHMQVYNKQVN